MNKENIFVVITTVVVASFLVGCTIIGQKSSYKKDKAFSLYYNQLIQKEASESKNNKILEDKVIALSSNVKLLENENLKLKEANKKLNLSKKNKIGKIEITKKEEATTVIEINKEDRELLYKLVEAESGADSLNGRIAVANVIINRVRSKNFPNTIHSVMYQKYQFEPVYNSTVYNMKPTKLTIEAVNKALAGQEVVPENCYFFWGTYLDKNNSMWNDYNIITTYGDNVFATH